MVDTTHFPVGARVNHAKYGAGRITGLDAPFYIIKFLHETIRIPFDYPELVLLTSGDPQLEQLKLALTEVLTDFGLVDLDAELGNRWQGGELVLVPGKSDTQSKKIPIDAFFKKVVGVREKLRVLEQKINNHANLTGEEKLDLQGYITRAYGSLTSFNVLFSDEGTPFKGSGGE